ncbi:hypothetical protein BZG36_01287 [Bifiguratus adelaidae]|uniref:Ribophorin II n=1 Tax=Bifiguratus adelaidae TaxID=1938954 RepID=A0A261Y5A5_9FUNG|nr:hypothetical protein BZG36_01287 [Bifiguratus adelaidae]
MVRLTLLNFTSALVALVLLCLVVRVDADVTISDVKLAVVGSDGVRKFGESLTYPSTLSKPLNVTTQDTLRVSIFLKDTKAKDNLSAIPHQAFVVFDDVQGVERIVRVIQLRDSGKGRAELDLKSATDLPNVSRTYTASLILGSFSHAPIRYELGKVTLPASSRTKKQAIDSSFTHQPFGPKPEIQHLFRQGEKMPPKIVSLIGTGAVLAPWILLLGMWAKIGLTPSRIIHMLRTTPAKSLLTTLAFLVTLGLVETVLLAYFTYLNLFQTLGYLGVLMPVAFLTGQRCLSDVQSRRWAGMKKAE